MMTAYLEPIDLFRGWPNPTLLPVSHIKAASEAALSDSSVYIPGLLYGPDDGFKPLRESVAAWLSDFYQEYASPIGVERIIVTGGASQNLACILQAFTDPLYTRHIWMVTPTYYLACRIFEDAGFYRRLKSVPEDQEGIDIELLEEALKEADRQNSVSGDDQPNLRPPRPERKIYRHMIYAVPTFSNPSGGCMSLRRREQLVQLARRHDALIVTDDVYDQLRWPGTPSSSQSYGNHAYLPRIVDIDRSLDGGAEADGKDGFGNAVSNGSFSKIVGPGCRTGWMEGTPRAAWAVSQVGSTKSGGAPSQLTASVMWNLLQSGDLQAHVAQTLQPTYARRYQNMVSAIEKHLVPLGVSLPQKDYEVVGGYFIWISLPKPLQAEEVATRAAQHWQLIIIAGNKFAVWGDQRGVEFTQDIRLTFSWEKEQKLIEGIERLAAVIKNMQQENQHQNGKSLG